VKIIKILTEILATTNLERSKYYDYNKRLITQFVDSKVSVDRWFTVEPEIVHKAYKICSYFTKRRLGLTNYIVDDWDMDVCQIMEGIINKIGRNVQISKVHLNAFRHTMLSPDMVVAANEINTKFNKQNEAMINETFEILPKKRIRRDTQS
jgi:hypothetical protein